MLMNDKIMFDCYYCTYSINPLCKLIFFFFTKALSHFLTCAHFINILDSGRGQLKAWHMLCHVPGNEHRQSREATAHDLYMGFVVC